MMAEKNSKTYYVSAKNRNVALLLSALGLIGLAGFHRFYVGKIWSGILYFSTLGLLGIGTIYDIIKICIEDFEDADGFPLYSDSSMKANYKRRNLQSPPGFIKICFSLVASWVLLSMILVVVIARIVPSDKIANESAEKPFPDLIKMYEQKVTKEELDSFLDDAKQYHLSETNIRNLCATLKALNIDFMNLRKINLAEEKRKDWFDFLGRRVYSTHNVSGRHEIAYKIPDIEQIDGTDKRYLIIHLDDKTKEIKSISVRKDFDSINRAYDIVYYLCKKSTLRKDNGALIKYGDYSIIFVSQEAFSHMKDTINKEILQKHGHDFKIGEFEYRLIGSVGSDAYGKNPPYVEVDVECVLPSQTYGVSEERMYKTFNFSTDGQLKEDTSWNRHKKQK